MRFMQARSAGRESIRLAGRREVLRGFLLEAAALLAPAGLRAQNRRTAKVRLASGKAPQALLERSVVFPRAYAACPQPDYARRSIETARFPHAFGEDDLARVLPPYDNESVEAILKRRGRDTILAYVAPFGDGQDTPFERSVNVPLAIYAPGLLEPRRAEEILISTVDLAPTLLGLSGLPIPEGVQGRDLSAPLLHKGGELPDSVYVEGGIGTKQEWRMVIRGYEKLALALDGNVTHMYNLAKDPDEQVNLAGETASQVRRDSLVALAQVWMRKLGDGVDASGLRRRQ